MLEGMETLDDKKKPLSVEVLNVAKKLQELVDRKYRGKVQVVFHPAGVIKGAEVIEFFYAKGESDG